MDLILCAFQRATGERLFFAFSGTDLAVGATADNDVQLSGPGVLGRHLALRGNPVSTEEVVWVVPEPEAAAAAQAMVAANLVGELSHWTASMNGTPVWPVQGPRRNVPIRVGDILRIGMWELSLQRDDALAELQSGVERKFLGAIERAPWADDERSVYSDWLEQQGRPEEAEFVRLQIELKALAATDPRSRIVSARLDRIGPRTRPAWRRIVARAHVENCDVTFAFECPKTWDALTTTDDPNIRHCIACDSRVHYASDASIARSLARRRLCVAVDVATPRSSWRATPQGPPRMGRAILPTLATSAERAVAQVRILLKAETQGLLEAVANAMGALSNDHAEVVILLAALGDVTPGDLNLAIASRSIVLGLNVGATPDAAAVMAEMACDVVLVAVIDEALDAVRRAVASVPRGEPARHPRGGDADG